MDETVEGRLRPAGEGADENAGAGDADATRDVLGAPPPVLERTGPRVGARIGPFLLHKKLAAGGMGVVYEAEQDRPRRKVALKTLRAGSWTPEQVRRFRHEVDVLGMLQHPCIAQIHEAGTYDDHGEPQPYFAMELVPGARTILAYAREHALDLEQRLALFLAACDAIHYGHTKGVIHRDIKPGNVLVSRDGRVKVIDFGLARVVDPSAASVALSLVDTEPGMLLGTLPYMSPEHVTGSAFEVDAQSDVYSLGCLLHELLTGRRPLDTTGLALPAALLRIERGEVELSSDLPRDLRWIVARALEPSPRRRYPSVAELAAEVQRFLDDDPVQAASVSATYRLGRFARRNRTELAFVGAIVLALSIGLLRAHAAYQREADARVKADDARKEAEAAKDEAVQALARAESERQLLEKVGFVLDFFVDSLNPFRAGREAKVLSVIEEEVIPRLPATRDPRVHAFLEGWVGQAYLSLRDFEQSLAHLEPAWREAQEVFEPDSAYRLRIGTVYADLLERTGHVRESADLSEALLPVAERTFGPSHRRASYLRYNLAVCLGRLGEPARAEELLRIEVGHAEQRGAGASIFPQKDLASVVAAQGRLDEALGMYRAVLDQLIASEGPDSFAVGTVQAELAGVSLQLGRVDEAAAALAESERIARQGPPSPQNDLVLFDGLLQCQLARGELEAAEGSIARLEACAEQLALPPGQVSLAIAVGRAEVARRRAAPEAEALAEAACAAARELVPAEVAEHRRACLPLARLLVDTGEAARATALLDELGVPAEGGADAPSAVVRELAELRARVRR